MPPQTVTDDVYSEVATPKAAVATTFDKANKEAERSIKPNVTLYISLLVALLQPLQSGWSTSQMNLTQYNDTTECNARPVAEDTCLMFPGHSKLEWTFAVNAWIFGGMIGSLCCGHFSDQWGRKKLLFANCAFMIAGGVVQAAVSNIWAFAVGRAISGIASGVATATLGGIFADAGISDSRIGTLIIDFINIFPAFGAGPLTLRFGYRPTVLWGIAGMCIMAICMTISFLVDVPELSIVFTALYVIAFGATLGPLTWVVTADLFPDSIRASGSALCIGINWLCNLVVGVGYPYVSDALDDYAYLPFVVLLVIFYLLALKLIPETAGPVAQNRTQYAAVGLMMGTLPSTITPFLSYYLNMEGQATTSARALLGIPWSIKVFIGIISDCFPICGFRRRPFMIIGWLLCTLCLIVMAILPLDKPYFPEASWRSLKPSEYTTEEISAINYHAPSTGGKYVVLMMMATLGIFGSILCRAVYQVIAYSFFSGVFGGISYVASDPVTMFWARATSFNISIAQIVGSVVTAFTLAFIGRYGLDWDWRHVIIVTTVMVVTLDSVCTMLTTWDIIRNQWFWLGFPIVETIPASVNFIVSTFVVVELADKATKLLSTDY
eukprot:jgi/Phyca11/18996/fgenesh1_pg.PHYCAscaffold_42_\